MRSAWHLVSRKCNDSCVASSRAAPRCFADRYDRLQAQHQQFGHFLEYSLPVFAVALWVLTLFVAATSSSNSTEHSATTHIPALLKALDALRPSSVDDRAARALMGSQLLQDPSCADSAVKFAENASIVAVTLVTFVEDDKAAAITSANNDVKTFIFQSCTKHVGKIHDLLNSGESLLAKVVIYAVDTATGTADVKDAGIPVSALLSVVSSEDGRYKHKQLQALQNTLLISIGCSVDYRMTECWMSVTRNRSWRSQRF